jgi:phosphotransferase system, enzyme I, PtsP
MSPQSRLASSSSREILRRLNEIMGADLSAQAKLNRVVKTLGKSLSSEVCSVYVLREGLLELFATQGLARDAVHVTKLRFGEGLVGTIAEQNAVLNLAEARAHPNFAYRPETGEELFHSFAGVPIVRANSAVGVLCVQHVDPRDYSEEEIESLQTVAMVLSEMLTNAGVINDAAVARQRAQRSGSQRLAGLKLVEGLGRGVAVFHQPRVEIEHTVADDIDVEKGRLRAGLITLREQIDDMLGKAEFAVAGEQYEILETYKMFALDEGWARRITDAIDEGLTAEAAIERVAQKTRANMRKTQDPYLLERLQDLEDLANRLIRILAGKFGTAAAQGLAQDAILIARSLGPAELLEYDRRHLKGVALEEGSLTSHVTILARAMGVPMLGRVKGIRDAVSDGDPLILDSVSEALFVRPTPDVVRGFEAQVALRAKRQAAYAKVRDLPAVSKDGQKIDLMINAGLRTDLPALEVTNADGIGLFRTEFQFLVSATLPRREAQTKLYQDVLQAAGDRPVIFRTVDIGGDKAVPYMQGDYEEENPALGWRALRLALERSGLLKVQSRALLQASAGRTLNLMFPMVTEVSEYEDARAIVEAELAALAARNLPTPALIRYGVMLEVPALAYQLDALLPRVDFLSVGTNDLTQFLFAADRSHPKLANRYDWLGASLLRFLKAVVSQAHKAGVPVSVCGEMGGRPIECLALLGLGIRRVSITPAAVGPIKMMIRASNLKRLQRLMDQELKKPAGNLRQSLVDFAAAQRIPLN